MSHRRVLQSLAPTGNFFPPSMAGTGCVRRDVLCVLSNWLSALGPALASLLRAGIGGDGRAPGVGQRPLCGAGRPGKFLRACRGAAGERQRGAAWDGLRSGRRVVPGWASRSQLPSSGTALRSVSRAAGASTRSIAGSTVRPSPPPPVSSRSLLPSFR